LCTHRTEGEDRRSTGSQREYFSTGVTLRMAHKTLLTSRSGPAPCADNPDNPCQGSIDYTQEA
jgi:hypothetical protein